MIDEVMHRQDGDPRRFELHLDVLRRRARQRAQVQQGGARGVHDDARWPLLKLRDRRLAERPRDLQPICIGLGDSCLIR
jgi:hypothetical protein